MTFREGLKKIKKLAFDQLSQTPPAPTKLALNFFTFFYPFFFLMEKKNIFFLSSLPSLPYYSQSQNCTKLYNTYYLLRLLMMVCTLLIWFILTVLQESSNLDAIFIVCRQIKNKISKLAFSSTPPPHFLVKSQLFKKKLTLPLGSNGSKT